MSDAAKRRRSSHLDRANLVARRLVKVVRSYDGSWAVDIDGWYIHGYDCFRTKKDAMRGRQTVVQHLDAGLYRAGVK